MRRAAGGSCRLLAGPGAAFGDPGLPHWGSFQAAAATQYRLSVRQAVAPVLRPWVKTPITCGGTGLAGIGQLADMAIGQGPAMGGEIGAVWGLR